MTLILWVFTNSKGQGSTSGFYVIKWWIQILHEAPRLWPPCGLSSYVSIQLYHMAFRFVFLASFWSQTRSCGWAFQPILCGKQPLSFHASRRLIGISRLPDSSSIKSHFANLTIWDWMKNKSDGMNEGEGERERACMVDGEVENEKDKNNEREV